MNAKTVKDVLAPLTMKCVRCGHMWLRRVVTQPVKCPKCQSPYWDRPKQQERNDG